MKTIIITADLSHGLYPCLNLPMMFEQAGPLDILMVFEGKKHELAYYDVFEELILNFQTAFMHNESSLQLHITQQSLDKEIKAITEQYKESFICANVADGNDSIDTKTQKEQALQLMKNAEHHVITLPTDKIPSAIRRIVFPVHHLSKVRHKVTATAKLAKRFNAEVHVLNTQTTGKPSVVKQCAVYTRQITKHFLMTGVNAVPATIQGANLVDVILKYAASNHADLISVIPQPRTKGKFGKKSYIGEIVNKSTIPLMVVGPRKLRGVH